MTKNYENRNTLDRGIGASMFILGLVLFYLINPEGDRKFRIHKKYWYVYRFKWNGSNISGNFTIPNE